MVCETLVVFDLATQQKSSTKCWLTQWQELELPTSLPQHTVVWGFSDALHLRWRSIFSLHVCYQGGNPAPLLGSQGTPGSSPWLLSSNRLCAFGLQQFLLFLHPSCLADPLDTFFFFFFQMRPQPPKVLGLQILFVLESKYLRQFSMVVQVHVLHLCLSGDRDRSLRDTERNRTIGQQVTYILSSLRPSHSCELHTNEPTYNLCDLGQVA